MKTYVGRKGATALEEHIKKQTDMEVRLAVAAKGMNVKQFTDLGCGEVSVEYTSEKKTTIHIRSKDPGVDPRIEENKESEVNLTERQEEKDKNGG